MSRFMKMLYKGKLDFSNGNDLGTEPIRREVQSARDRLYKKLNDEEKAIFDEYQAKTQELTAAQCFNAFMSGYHTSSQLMLEAIGFKKDPRQEQNQ